MKETESNGRETAVRRPWSRPKLTVMSAHRARNGTVPFSVEETIYS